MVFFGKRVCRKMILEQCSLEYFIDKMKIEDESSKSISVYRKKIFELIILYPVVWRQLSSPLSIFPAV